MSKITVEKRNHQIVLVTNKRNQRSMAKDGDERSERAGQGGTGSEVASRTLVYSYNKYVLLLLLAFDCLGKCANSVTSSL